MRLLKYIDLEPGTVALASDTAASLAALPRVMSLVLSIDALDAPPVELRRADLLVAPLPTVSVLPPFWSAVGASTSLTALDVRGALADAEGVAALGAALRTNRSLLRVDFDGASLALTPAAAQALRGAFYGNKKVAHLGFPEVV